MIIPLCIGIILFFFCYTFQNEMTIIVVGVLILWKHSDQNFIRFVI